MTAKKKKKSAKKAAKKAVKKKVAAKKAAPKKKAAKKAAKKKSVPRKKRNLTMQYKQHHDYYKFSQGKSKCECGWSGPNDELSIEGFSELFEIYCPTCERKFGIVSYPSDASIEHYAALGNAEAIKDLASRHRWRDFAKNAKESQITEISQLRDLQEQEIKSSLHLVQDDDKNTWLVIVANGQEIGRELCFWEEIEPAYRLKDLLQKKFGGNLVAFDPMPAYLYLCGDNSSLYPELERLTLSPK